jgi:membrane protein DedA with SNARE-associated domain
MIPKSKYLAILAFIALGLYLIELSGVLGVPFGGVFQGSSGSSFFSSQRVVSLMSSLGYVSLFALMTLESASLPIPSEVVLPFSGYLVYIGVMNFGAALAISTAAALLGAFIDYYLARILGSAFVERFLRWFRIDHKNLRTAERWFAEKGTWTVFGARFVPLLRSLISLPAGLFRMPLWSFTLFTVIGCVIWNAVLIYAGYAAGSLWESVVGSSFSFFVNVVLAALAAVSALYLIYYGYNRARN